MAKPEPESTRRPEPRGPAAETSARRHHRFVVALFLLALAALVVVMWPFLGAFFTAALLGAVLHPLQMRLQRRLGGRPNVAAGLLTTATVVVVVIPVGLITVALVDQGIEVVNDLARKLRTSGVEGVVEPLPAPLQQAARYAFDMVPESLLERFGVHTEASAAEAAGEVGDAAPAAGDTGEDSEGAATAASLRSGVEGVAQLGDAASAAGTALAGVFDLLIRTGLLIVALFFCLTEGHRLVDYLVRLVPLEEERTRDMLHTSRSIAVGVLLSVLATAGAQTLVALVGYLIAGVDALLLLVGATFVLSFIPTIGGATMVTTTGIVLWLSGRTGAGVFLTAWGLVAVSLIDNVVKPYVAKDHAQLPGSLVFFAMICGLAVFGPMGLVAGPLVVAFFKVTAGMLLEERAAGM